MIPFDVTPLIACPQSDEMDATWSCFHSDNITHPYNLHLTPVDLPVFKIPQNASSSRYRNMCEEIVLDMLSEFGSDIHTVMIFFGGCRRCGTTTHLLSSKTRVPHVNKVVPNVTEKWECRAVTVRCHPNANDKQKCPAGMHKDTACLLPHAL